MTTFASFAELRAALANLPTGDAQAAASVAARDANLTKPPRSLGRLEELIVWLARWQGKSAPRLDRVDILVFAGNHGVTEHDVSAYPAAVTAQMVSNFLTGGAAINQLATSASADLTIMPLSLERPTADFTREPAMSERDFLDAVAVGYDTVRPHAHLVCVGEMGIGNTTAAAAVAAALFGGGAVRWVGRGTGVDDARFKNKLRVVDEALARHKAILRDPLAVAAALGGRELAAVLGAVLAARQRSIPVLLDGFVATAAVAPLFKLHADALAHTLAAHVSGEAGHKVLLAELGLQPLLDLGMRLGEASGAAVGVLILRAALACHTGMATFAEAGVAEKS
jgi:nicotinate-nucleotide--dimethylbenzimidazole phosphoribosyltransferase